MKKRKENKQWSESKANTRTRSWKSNPSFDNFLSDLTINELEFLIFKRKKDITDYIINHKTTDKEFQEDINELKQTFNMLNEEIRTRRSEEKSSNSFEIRFNPQEDTIIDSDNNTLESIAYNYDETEIINLPSGNKGKVESKWEPELEQDYILDYGIKKDCDLPWNEWCKKKDLIYER